MNTKLQEKIAKLKQQEQEKQDQENIKKIKAEVAHKKIVNSKINEAKVWVENILLDIIAKEDLHLEKQKKSIKEIHLYPDYCGGPLTSNLPLESVILAIKSFEGLKVREEWVRESTDPNDETNRTITPAHYEYYVQW